MQKRTSNSRSMFRKQKYAHKRQPLRRQKWYSIQMRLNIDMYGGKVKSHQKINLTPSGEW